jgi:hypothetical protein
LSNINLLAPILISMWKHWANLSNVDIEMVKRNVIDGTGFLRELADVMNLFLLSMLLYVGGTSTH